MNFRVSGRRPPRDNGYLQFPFATSLSPYVRARRVSHWKIDRYTFFRRTASRRRHSRRGSRIDNHADRPTVERQRSRDCSPPAIPLSERARSEISPAPSPARRQRGASASPARRSEGDDARIDFWTAALDRTREFTCGVQVT